MWNDISEQFFHRSVPILLPLPDRGLLPPARCRRKSKFDMVSAGISVEILVHMRSDGGYASAHRVQWALVVSPIILH